MIYRYWVCISLVITFPLYASERFKDVDLWLPKAYQNKYSRLLVAAEKAENDPYCFQLLSGRVLESQSTIDHIQFYFRCRAEDRKTFSLQIDGKSLVVTNDYAEKQLKIAEARLTAEEREAKRVQQQKEANAEKIMKESLTIIRREQSQYWTICRKEMRRRLQTFEQVSILTEPLPEPTIQADQFTYTVLFDSLNPAKKTLHFQIVCTISALDYYEVGITPRKVNN